MIKRIFGTNEGKNLTFKYAVVNKKERKGIDHNESENTRELQNSRFI